MFITLLIYSVPVPGTQLTCGTKELDSAVSLVSLRGATTRGGLVVDTDVVCDGAVAVGGVAARESSDGDSDEEVISPTQVCPSER